MLNLIDLSTGASSEKAEEIKNALDIKRKRSAMVTSVQDR